MTKLIKHERLRFTHAIEDALDNYCRADCPYLDSRDADRVCMTCPVGVRLQGFGAKLMNNEIKAAKKVVWTPELDAKFIDLLSKAKYGEMEKVAQAMGLPIAVCRNRKFKLSKKGLIL